MKDKQYDLYFGSRKVGVVTETANDFPNLWGNITFESCVVRPCSPQEQRFARFMELNKESIRLVDMEHVVDTSRDQAVVNAQLDSEYSDYADSEEWCLRSPHGHTLSILCPIFRGDNEIVWRWA